MIVNQRTLQSLAVCLLSAVLMVGCRYSSLSGNGTTPRCIDLAELQDPSISCTYVDQSILLPSRPGSGRRFLRTHIDSASYAQGLQILYVNGQVLESDSSNVIAGALIMIGTLQRREGQIISADRRPPTPSYHYQMIPQYEDTTDTEGRFRLSVRIDSASSLMIARKGYYIELYNVGRLVDSLRTK